MSSAPTRDVGGSRGGGDTADGAGVVAAGVTASSLGGAPPPSGPPSAGPPSRFSLSLMIDRLRIGAGHRRPQFGDDEQTIGRLIELNRRA